MVGIREREMMMEGQGTEESGNPVKLRTMSLGKGSG